MMFDYPIVLSGFLVFILIFFFNFITGKKRQKLPKELETKLFLSSFFFNLFLAFSIIALASPRWGTGFAPSEFHRGLDAVFAVDVSRSMDINDVHTASVSQTRLKRGLSICRESVITVNGARFAAAIGRGSGYLAVPLTYDSEAAQAFLESIDGSSMTGRSTNLESLIDAAIDAFQKTSPARKIIVLVSDGESHSGLLKNAVNRCAREGIIIISVAVGSDEGQRIQERANDPDSPAVISRRDAAVMRSAAERTGGIYIDGNREDAGSTLSSHLLSLAQESASTDNRKEQKQRQELFIILAIISLTASKFATRQTQKKLKHIIAASIITMSIFFTSCTEGRLLLLEAGYLHSRGRYDEALVPYLKALNFKESAPYAEYGLGLTFYALDETDAAKRRYADSQKLLEIYSGGEHRELRYRNFYNSGVILFEDGDYKSAADAFKEALRADPARIEAKQNLELSLMSINMEAKTENRQDMRPEQREMLFDYLKQEEQQLWKSREWAPEDDYSGPDY